MKKRIICVITVVMILAICTGCGDGNSEGGETENLAEIAESNVYTDNFIINVTNSTGTNIKAATVKLVVNGYAMEKEVIEDGIKDGESYSILMVPELNGFKVTDEDEVAVTFTAQKNDEDVYSVDSEVLSKDEHYNDSAYEFSLEVCKDDSDGYILKVF